ncbi:uncharacterized protein LOC134259646 [Saccostrea cucullata]|uniref:uncharacterized protein LOC134259646 n=1 Tax=Saccostrea cuccullata TaxID=36930 RepID=UPI002ED577E3
MADKHNRDHIFRRIMTSGFKGPIMPKRSNSEEKGKRKEICRITKDCDVTAVTTNMKGKVLRFWKGKVSMYELDGKNYPFQLNTEEELIANDTVLNMLYLPSLTVEMVRNIPGIRVMMEDPTKENTETMETYIVGTLVKYKEHDGKLELQIKWDGSDNNNPKEEQYCVPGEESPLKLFDAGIVTTTTCKGCGKDVNRIRWKGNDDNYFCTFCNITSESVSSEWHCGQMSGKLTDKEMLLKKTKVRLFEEDIVIKKRQGNCLWPYPGMCKNNSESTERTGKFRKKELLIPVQVQSADGYIFLHDICDLKIKREDEWDKANQFYYQDHLQNLGQDGTEYVEAKIRHGEKMHVTEIQIHLWKEGTSTSWDTSYNPSLLFILMDDMEECLEDIISFFRNSSVPCYLACQKVLLWNSDQDIGTSCGVHHSTTKQTIEKLLENGCTIFKIMSGKEEADLKYFMDMAKRYLGEEVIPVILKSNEKFKLDETTLEEAKTEIIPIVSAKISDFTRVAWPSKETLSDDRKKNKSLSNNKIRGLPKKQDDRQDIDESNIDTYIVNTSRPWEVKQWNKKNLSKENLEYGQWFFKTKEVKLDNIIPLILVGVAMHIFHVRKVTGLHDKLQNSGAVSINWEIICLLTFIEVHTINREA